MSILATPDLNDNPSSFLKSPAMRKRTAERLASYSGIASKSVALYKESKNDLDQSGSKDFKDLDQSGSIPADPDGLNSQIKGVYAEFLRKDPASLLARSWKVHPSQLTNAIKRMGIEWVRQQVDFVSNRPAIGNRGRYLAAILARNTY